MAFYPKPCPVPVSLRREDFVLVPLALKHNVMDFAALAESAYMLRVWSGSGWPADEYSLVHSKDDLSDFSRAFRNRAAFTYAVLNPAETHCLGCVYITPLSRLAEANPVALAGTAPDAATVGFWVRQACLASGLEPSLLAALRDWMREAWAFSSVVFMAREADTRQVALLTAAGLERYRSVTVPGRDGPFLLFRDARTDSVH